MAKPPNKQKCPICGKPPSEEFSPFCSRGCKDRDLLKWLGDGYRVPGPPADPESLVDGRNGLDSDAPDRL
ncbi:MAG: DNA gyrase inhibitor YacG [Sphingomonadales bacterium]|nr:DNA gyrase inhibitor YacG [Sphingomonadales bacterium]